MTRADRRHASGWPLIRREMLHEQVVAALASRPFGAAMLTGSTGIGKSTLARQVLEEVESSGRPVVHVPALRELQGVPFGAFAPALGAENSRAPSDLTTRLADVVGTIAADRDTVLFVDDAPLLDSLSAAAVYQLVRVSKLTCLLTARDEHPLTGPIQRLDHEGVVKRIPVAPMTTSEVDYVLAQRLGAPIEPESVRAFHRRSAGNPLVVRTLTEAAEEQQTIHASAYGFVLDEPRLPRHVGQIMSEQLATLTTAQRKLARLVALAQPVRADLIDGDPETDALSANDFFVDSAANGTRQLTIFHPLAAQVLIDEMGDNERQSTANDASAMLERAGDEQLRFRSVMLRARYELAESATNLAWAAGFAAMVQDYELARRLATRANTLEPSFEGMLALGAAESMLGRSVEATTALETARTYATDERERALGTLRLGHHLAIRAGRPNDAVLLAEVTLGELREPDARAVLEADLVKWRSMSGSSLPALGDASAFATDDGFARLGTLINQAMVGSMLGQTAATRAAVDEARPLAFTHRARLPFADDLLDLNEFLVLVFDGELKVAEEFVRSRFSSLRADSSGQWNYTIGLLSLHTGRVPEAERIARAAVHELERRDFTGLLGAAQALHATTLAQLGRRVECRTVLDQLADIHRQDVKVVLQAAEAEAAALVSDGDRDAATTTILNAGAAGVAQNHLALSALTLYSAVRFGATAAVRGPIAELASTTGSRLIGVMRDHCDAELSDDPERLTQVAQQLEQVGLIAGARRLWRQSAAAFDRRAQPERARAAIRALDNTDGDDAFVDPIERSSSIQAMLTAREWQVARAAAGRQRSGEIAASLGLSSRTVDNHLARVYRKLGVRSRLELAQALIELDE